MKMSQLPLKNAKRRAARACGLSDARARLLTLAALLCVAMCALLTSRFLPVAQIAPLEAVEIRAASEQPSWLRLRAAKLTDTVSVEAKETTQALDLRRMHARSLAAADFDEDGVPDLLGGYATETGGLVSVRRGNADAIYPRGPQAEERRTRGEFEGAPFYATSRILYIPAAADFLGAGDFNADGHWDAVAAQRGDNALYLLRGDGGGSLAEPERIPLAGSVTALSTGDINRRDGLTDLLVGVENEEGARLLVFEHAKGALRAEPESFALSAAALSIAPGQLDDKAEIDFVIAVGNELVTISGRDRRTSLDTESRAKISEAGLRRIGLGVGIVSVVVGDFTGDYREEIAALLVDGTLRVLEREAADKSESAATQAEGASAWRINDTATVSLDFTATHAVGSRLVRAKVSSLPKDDLIVWEGMGGGLRVVTETPTEKAWTADAMRAASNRLSVAASFDVSGGTAAALPMRLNESALHSVVVLGGRDAAPSVLMSRAAATITVNTTVDNNVRDSVLTLDEAIRVANGTLSVSALTAGEQAQISGAPANPGLDSIHFNIPGAGVPTITVVGTLPTISDAIVIDGTTQPGVGRVEVVSPDSGVTHNFLITAGASTVRGMVLNGASSGVELQTNGNNIIEGNLIGTNTDGTAAAAEPNGNQVFINNSPNNTIGGTTAAARNVLSAGTAFSSDGIDIRGAASTGNIVAGNYIGTNAAGTAVIGNRNDGLFLSSAPNNTIGGTTAGAGNLIAGVNSTSGAGIQLNSGCAGTLIQGNLIGLDKDGAAALANRGYGVRLASGITLGGTSPTARNFISASGRDGIYLETTSILVQGNHVGTNATGTSAVPNSEHGINMNAESNNTVGGAVEGARNLISGNLMDGVNLADTFGANPDGNRIQGNYIGTDATGTLPLPNQGDGIDIFDTDNTLIGGINPAERNLISGNRLSGIEVTPANDGYLKPVRIEGNYIGTNAFGTGTLSNGGHGIFFTNNGNGMTVGGAAAGAGNVIAFNGGDGIASGSSASVFVVLGNSIFLNSGLGLDRGDNGPDPNGATLTRNAPVLTSATTNGNTTTIGGTLQQNHATPISYTVQFFSNDACDASGFGEGQTLVGETTVQITNNSPINFSAQISPSVAGGKFITALAVGQSSTTAGLLTASEFSACAQVSDVTPNPTPTPGASPTPSPTATPTPPPAIFTVAPNRGGNAGSVTSRVAGQGFRSGARVALRRAGMADNFGGLVHVDANGASLTVTFDLVGASPGVYDVVVINPDNSTATLPGAFTVEAGGGAEVWADFMGRARNRVNSNARFFIMVGNRGNTDAYHVPVFLAGLPHNSTIHVEFEVLTPPPIPNADPVDYNTIPVVSGNETGRLVPIVVPRLRPGQVVALPITVRMPEVSQATLSIRASKPMVSSLDFVPNAPAKGAAHAAGAGQQVIARFAIDLLDPNLINCLAAIIKFAASEVLGTLLGDSCVDLVKQILLNELPNFLGNAVGLAAADDGFGEGFSFAQIFTQLIQIGLKSALCAANIVLPQARLVALALKFADIAALIETGIEICDACFDNFCSDLIKRFPLIFIASNDPNDKTGARGSGAERYLTNTAPLPYSIFFENLSTATAPAQRVVITDQLDASKFDLSTFRFGDIFFGSTQVDVPEVSDAFTLDKDLRPARNLIVRISGQRDQSTGLLTWTFASLDPLTGQPPDDPDAGFLPPNLNPPEGDGAVLFTVSPKTSLVTGDQIRNGARIIFDTNAPIDTPQWLNTIDHSRPESRVAPLTATQPYIVFNVHWSGNDTGSGIQSYRVFASEDGGPYVGFLSTTTATSGIFIGQPGKSYSFYVLARDHAGNDEAIKTTAEATTLTPAVVTNAIDDVRFFVLQHYRDFLGRDPDPAGFDFWTNEITACGADARCREVKRINVSAAFYLSIEFQETGYLVYRFFKTAYGDAASPNVPGTVPVIRREEFLPDMQQIGQGVEVGIGNWEQQLEQNKQAFALEFVRRQRFLDAYPPSLAPAELVDGLNQKAGGVLSPSERNQLISELSANNTEGGRASVLRKVAEDTDLKQREFNRAFVLMQYYGYLRRNPDDPPDTNFDGWKFWLDKLDQFNGNFIEAEMVKAFISSLEYRRRFGN